jgi:hypothetical protein
LALKWGRKDLFIDLGAEILAAEKGSVRIAVEVKSFAGPSEVDDLEKALGQFTLYHDVLAIRDPDRVLYLAISLDAFQDVFEEGPGKLLLENNRVRLLTFNPAEEVIVKWLPSTPTEILSSGS